MRTVRAFGKELSEVNKYTEKTDQVFSLARKEAVLRAGFFGVVSVCQVSKMYTAQYHKSPICLKGPHSCVLYETLYPQTLDSDKEELLPKNSLHGKLVRSCYRNCYNGRIPFPEWTHVHGCCKYRIDQNMEITVWTIRKTKLNRFGIDLVSSDYTNSQEQNSSTLLTWTG